MVNCRNCNYNLFEFMTFGKMPIANAFVEKNEFKKEYFFELAPTYCPACSLFQLKYQPNPNKLFHDNYAFFANTSNHMQDHFQELSKKIINNFSINKDDLIIEIGNNDGGMVRFFNDLGYQHLGVDPSKNVSDFAKSLGVNVLNDFFNIKTAKQIKNEYGKAKVFLSANTLAHIPDINSVFEGINFLLADDGVFITEYPYLINVLDQISYDQIYDEHVFIFSLTSIQNICKKFNLEVFDVEKLQTAGGSLRYYIARKGFKNISGNVKSILLSENKYSLYSEKTYLNFKDKCETSKIELKSLLDKLSESKTIVSYGATSKTTTIFNYCDINTTNICFITDTTPNKQGKYSPGKHIPIYNYEYFRKNIPDYCFLGAWNHSSEIFKKEKNFFSEQGKWITHTPSPKVL